MPRTSKSPAKKPARTSRKDSFTRLNKTLDKTLEAMPRTSKSPAKKPARASRKDSFTRLNKTLDKTLEAMLDSYFKMLANYKTQNLHELVLARVERKLLEYVLQSTDSNQARAADILGISRSTLRAKIRAYNVTLKKTSPRTRRPDTGRRAKKSRS